MVFRSRATTCRVVALFLTLSGALASGQQPNRNPKEPPPPFPLLPAEHAWLTPLDAPTSAPAAMDASHTYIPLQNHSVVALDRETGVVAWTQELETAWAPLAANGMVYVTTPGALVALDAATGVQRWAQPLQRKPLVSPAYIAGRIILVLEQGDYVSLSEVDGTEQWRIRIPNDAPLFSPTAGAGQRLYVTLEGGQIVALSLTDGRLIWRQRLNGTLSAPAYAPGRLLVGSTDNSFYALDPDDGSIEWKWRVGGDVIGAVGDAEGRVYFASLDNLLRAVNRGNGNQRWKKEVSVRPAFPPRVFNDIVLLSGVAPVVTSYSTRTGAVVGTYTAPAELQGAPLIDPDIKPFRVAIVVVTRDGRAIGLRPSAMLYKEQPVTPLTTLPGLRLSREPRPAS